MIDNALMEAHLLVPIAVVLSTAFPEWENVFIVVCVVSVICRVAMLSRAASSGKASLVLPAVVLLGSCFVTAGQLGNHGDIRLFAAGWGALLFSPIFKFVDTGGVSPTGTALFHFVAAAGIALLWAWACALQRVPV